MYIYVYTYVYIHTYKYKVGVSTQYIPFAPPVSSTASFRPCAMKSSNICGFVRQTEH